MTGGGTEPPRWFFVHLQKTGGTALFRRLRHHFGTRAVYPMPEYQGTPETSLEVPLLLERFAAHREDIRVVVGHFPLCTTELLGVPFTSFTVLREPVERALSFLRHQQQEEPRFHDASLEEVYADPVCRDGLLRNHMVRMLSLRADEMTEGALTSIEVDDARLAVAKRNLTERIDVMGLQEHFEELCTELGHRYGWDLGPAQFANRTRFAGRSTPGDAGPELRARIRDDNAMDAELYAYAADLWAQRASARAG